MLIGICKYCVTRPTSGFDSYGHTKLIELDYGDIVVICNNKIEKLPWKTQHHLSGMYSTIFYLDEFNTKKFYRCLAKSGEVVFLSKSDIILIDDCDKAILDGFSFTITGEYDSWARKPIKIFIRNCGGHYSNFFTDKTTHVIAFDTRKKVKRLNKNQQSQKYQLALKNHKMIISLKKFWDIVKEQKKKVKENNG